MRNLLVLVNVSDGTGQSAMSAPSTLTPDRTGDRSKSGSSAAMAGSGTARDV